MFKNYLLITWRKFRQERFYTFLNIAGLAMGLACVILIVLWVNNETGYDKHFKNHEHIYRIECSLLTEGVAQPMVATDRHMASLLRRQYSKVCDAASIYKASTLLSSADHLHYEEQAYYADPTFFNIFSFDFISGNPKNPLPDSSSVVITDRTAHLLFDEANPIGDTLWVNNAQTGEHHIPYVVTGVIRENRQTSHIHPAAIFFKTQLRDAFEVVYISFHEGYTPRYFSEHIWEPFYRNTVIPNYYGERQDLRLDRLQPLTDIHLGGNKWEDFEVNGNYTLLYIFGTIGLVILLLAGINYVNLATARSFSRSREIAVRKVLGATRQNIIVQFLTESILTSLLALIIAFSLVEITLPFFNYLADKQINLRDIHWGVVLLIVLLGLITGLLAGIYPAFYISSFQPATTINTAPGNVSGKARLRQTLIAFQFSMSIIILIVTFIIRQQLEYLKAQELGFDADHTLVAYLNDEKAYAEREEIKKNLLQNLGITSVSVCLNIPGGGLNHTYIGFEQRDSMKDLLINSMFVDHDFPSLLKLKFTEGRSFDISMQYRKDSVFVIINESAKKRLGYTHATGKELSGGLYYGNKHGHIIGVVKDFHATSLHLPIEPLVIVLGTFGRPAGIDRYMLVKFNTADTVALIDSVRKIYMGHAFGGPFHFSFLNEQFNAQYHKEEHQVMLFNSFTIVSIFTSLLGLIGLAAFFMKQRTKEISIRMIAGASTRSLFSIFSIDYIRLMLLAWCIACPAAFVIAYIWLSTFAYHIVISPLPFFAAGSIVLIMILITVAVQTWLAIRLKPAEVLRYS